MAVLDLIRDFIDGAPIARWLGIRVDDAAGERTYQLTFDEAHIGNPAIRALHGGVIAAFLEFAMQAELVAAGAGKTVASTNVSIDYLTSSRAEDMQAKVRVRRKGRRIAFLEATGWQGDETRPVAIATACIRLG
ncbi:MAG: PaaI family thioesterase [Parvularculaceae bacterium]|nr:PaaI family thioesterase [Parvularculaceae bacterium]